MRLPTRKSEKERLLRQDEDNYLTPAKIEAMRHELVNLTKNQRRPAAEEVARTAQMGDLSENAAYQVAKQNLRRINNRIIILEERLKHAIPITQGVNDGQVRIGSTVTVHTHGRDQSFEILGSAESDPFKGRISYRSPLGQILIGKRVGDIVTLKTSKGETTYKIVALQ